MPLNTVRGQKWAEPYHPLGINKTKFRTIRFRAGENTSCPHPCCHLIAMESWASTPTQHQKRLNKKMGDGTKWHFNSNHLPWYHWDSAGSWISAPTLSAKRTIQHNQTGSNWYMYRTIHQTTAEHKFLSAHKILTKIDNILCHKTISKFKSIEIIK